MAGSFASYLLPLAVVCVQCVSTAGAWAKDEYRRPYMSWRLYGGNSGDFSSAEAVISAFNAKQEANFAACSGTPCASCSKTIHDSPSSIGFGRSIINGEYNVRQTTSAVATSYSPACTTNGVTRPAVGPNSSNTSNGIAAVLMTWCPGGSGASTRTIGTTTIEGQPVNVYEMTCRSSVHEPPPHSCPVGNPIDAAIGSKVADETDYVSADALLRVSRTYSSIAGRWSWAHTAALADLTGRSSTLPTQTNFIGNINLVPAGIYDGGSVPAAVPTPVTFTLAKTVWDNGQKEISVLSGGRRDVFTEGVRATFSTTSLGQPQLTLSVSPDGSWQWRVRRPNGAFQIFAADGNLTQVVSLDGKLVSYQRQGQSVTATAVPSGRTLVFANSSPQPVPGTYDTITLPDATQIRYQIDAAALVKSVSYPDNTGKTYVYDEDAKTGLTDGTKPGWMTGLIDENGVRVGTYTFDPTYRTAKTTERTGGVDKYITTVYPYNGRTDITLPTLGAPLASVYWELGPDGERRVTRRGQPAGAGCAASTSAVSYDANGNVASKDDFNGTRTCYANDLARNLETVRVEGLGTTQACSAVTGQGSSLPTGARKTSTQWHPDWRLETKRAEPKKLITNVYNGQPDPFNGNAVASCAPGTALLPDGKPIAVLCKSVEQTTTDAGGSLGFSAAVQAAVPSRTTSQTYNQHGQVLTSTDARGNTATYTYYADTSFTGADPNAVGHTIGDLQSVTNAAGHVTQHTLYDKSGRLLQSIDANGAVTNNQYSPRGWLAQLSVTPAGGGAALVTTYGYDLAGQLSSVTYPGQGPITYSYDAAHRLTGITDAAGNSVTYTLDNAGNRTKEEFKDPTEVLARSLNRAFDALNRVQAATGAAQ